MGVGGFVCAETYMGFSTLIVAESVEKGDSAGTGNPEQQEQWEPILIFPKKITVN